MKNGPDITTREAVRYYRPDGPALLPPVVERLAAAVAGPRLAACAEQRVQAEALAAFLVRLLRASLDTLGLFDTQPRPLAQIAGRIDAAHTRWLGESCRLLEQQGYLRGDASGYATTGVPTEDLDALWREWPAQRAQWPLIASHCDLVQATLACLPQILTGRRAATDILFPQGGLGIIEGVYRGTPIADYFNDLVADAAGFAADAARAAGRPLRLLEIGAGTGGTSRAVFERLDRDRADVAEYRYTDLSKAFLLHARENYRAGRPYLETALFDVERDAGLQQLRCGSYDVIIATNVLHATKNIRRTLRNAKALLRNGGMLVVNEMNGNGGAFSHLTFGLTPGWWLYEDAPLRARGGPGLSPRAWRTALDDEGYRPIAFPAQAQHEFGGQLILAGSDGVVRCAVATPDVALAREPAPRVFVTPETSVAPAVPPTPTAATLDSVRRAVVEELRHCLLLDEAFDGDESFADLGLDSIVGITFVRRLNDRLRIALDHTATFDHSNATKLARHILAAHAATVASRRAPTASPAAAAATAPVAPPRATPPAATMTPPARTAFDDASAPLPERIAIVGMSGVFARSADLDELWSHLAAGRDLVVPFPPRGDATGQPAPAGIVGGFLERIDEFDALFFAISGQEATYMDPQQRLFLQECWRALEDAGYAGAALDGVQCGVYVGASSGDYPQLFGEDSAPQALWGNLSSLIASRISYFLNLRGPALVIDTACSSSLVAIHLASQALAMREVDVALAGGVFMLSTSTYYASLLRAGMLSAGGRCHAFDARADGFVPAEGAGAIVLKRLADALADGDVIHGVLRGSGINQDGTSNGITAPSAASQEQLETAVYRACGLDARSIQLVEAHGTGTILGDPIEHSALCRAFRRHTDDVGFCALGSIKTNLGHPQAAAGIAGVLKVLLALKHRQMPASLHFDNPNPNIDFGSGPFFVNTRLRAWPENRDAAGNSVPRCAVVSSFGISGTNAHLVFEEAPARTHRSLSLPAWLVALSARTEAELRLQAQRLIAYVDAHAEVDAGDLSFTLLAGRRHFGQRLCLIVRDTAELAQALRQWLSGDAASPVLLSPSGGRRRPAGEPVEPVAQAIEDCRSARHSPHYAQRLAAVADLYLHGHEPDFHALLQGSGCARLALPTYPLLRDRYWVPPLAPRPRSIAAAADPAVPRNTSTLDEQRYSATIGADADGPGWHRSPASLPSMLRDVLRLSMPGAGSDWCLTDLRWGVPLDVGRDVHLGVYHDADGGALLELYSTHTEEREIHGQARAELGAGFGAETALDLGALRIAIDAGGDASAGERQWLVGCVAPTNAARVFERLSEILGGRDPLAAARIEGRGDWLDARWLWIRESSADRVDASVLADDGTLIGRIHGWMHGGDAADGYLLLGCNWRETAVAAREAWHGGVRRLLVAGGSHDDYLALREQAAAAIDVEHVASLDGAAFVDTCALLLQICKHEIARRPEAEVLLQVLVLDGPGAEPFAAGLAGFFKSAQKENPLLRGQVLRMPAAAAAEIWTVLERDAADAALEIWYDGARRVRTLVELPPPAALVEDGHGTLWKDGGTYLITGGGGDLGMLVAEGIAHRLRHARLILTGRSPLNAARSARLAALRLDGFDVDYRTVAIDDRIGMSMLFAEIGARGSLNGIVHAAGLIRDSYMIHKPASDLCAVLAPKVLGVDVLDELTRDLELDFLLLFSSITGEFGNAGQVDYAAGNAYLDGYARWRDAQVERGERRGRTLSINWPLWRNGGMQVDELTRRLLRLRGLETLDTQAGMRLLASALAFDAAQVVVLRGDRDTLLEQFVPGETAAPAAIEVAAGLPADELRARTGRKLVDLFARITQVAAERIDAGEPLESYGIDSVMITQLNAELDTVFGALSKTLFYEYRTLDALTDYLCTRHVPACERWCDAPRPTASAPPMRRPAPRSAAARPRLMSIATRARGGAAARHEPIAIIGMTGRYPGAPDLAAFWQQLCAGYDAIGEIPADRWPAQRWFEADVERAVAAGRYYTRSGGFLDGCADFDPLFFNIAPSDAYEINPQERLFLESCWATLEDAGYTRERLARQHRGRVGVFAGVTKNGYELHGPALWSRGERVHPNTSFGSVANRVSYVLDLNGPSMPVDTMCSASLTAIHEACEHLYRDDCELALAGGVNLYLHPSNYVTLCAQRMLSLNGRCMSFSADGDGFVPGEGVGSVLLKRLSAAQRDNDPIRAVIRGTAINHGGKTNGYTVPNPTAQAALVRAALARAGVDARQVSYIEAHGTGTRLGDPIEITGLRQAFDADTDARGYCAIGSLKSNIGHLEAAAGIAGLTKVVLQLQHGELVPSLHAQTLNPNIDFAATPFVVQRERAPWPRPQRANGGTGTRIAGISSFGAGGSNAHVVVEEYVGSTLRPAPAATGDVSLIVLSAKTAERLQVQAAQLLAALVPRDDDDLVAIAYTLQTGREAMDERLAFTARNLDQVRVTLQRFVAGERPDGWYRGQVQRNREALAIFDNDEDLRAAVASWMAKGKHDRLLSLWVKGLVVEWESAYGTPRPQRLALPTYPFARERYWISPDAAAAAPVPGQAHPLLHENTSQFSRQSFRSRFGGDEFFFADHAIHGQRILPGVAYLEMAREAVARSLDTTGAQVELRDVVWLRPLVGDAGADVDIVLDARDDALIGFEISTGTSAPTLHCRGVAGLVPSVRLPALDLDALRARCVLSTVTPDAFYAAFAAVGIVYGPAQRGVAEIRRGDRDVLARLIVPAAAGQGPYVLHPSLLDAALQATVALDWASDDDPALPSALVPFALDTLAVSAPGARQAWAWIRATDDADGSVRRIDLDLCGDDGVVTVALRGLAARRLDGAAAAQTRYLAPAWVALAPGIAAAVPAARHVVLCGWNAQVAQALSASLPDVQWQHVAGAGDVAGRFTQCATAVLARLRRIARERPEAAVLVQVVVADDIVGFDGIAALLLTAGSENPAIVGQALQASAGADAAALTAWLRDAASQAAAHTLRCTPQGLLSRQFDPLAMAEHPELSWKEHGVYWITGGAGGLGLIVADDIVRAVPRARVLLSGRRAPTEALAARLDAWRRAGVQVEYHAVALDDEAALGRWLDDVEQRLGPLNGIVHAAGVLRDAYLVDKADADVAEVFAPKVAGLVALDRATRERALDFVALFSSLAGAYGNPGQSDYAAANGFMDAYAAYRAELVAKGERHGRTVSINWPLWADGGMRVDASVQRMMLDRYGLSTLDAVDGMRAFHRALAGAGSAQVVVRHGAPAPRAAAAATPAPVVAPTVLPAAGGDALAPARVEAWLKSVLAQALKMPAERLDANAPLENYGIDSIKVMDLTFALEKHFGTLSKTLFFEYQNIADLAQYFVRRWPGPLRSLLGEAAATAAPAAAAAHVAAAPVLLRKAVPTRAAEPRATARGAVAIVGLSGRYPMAETLERFWDNLRDGRDCISEVPATRWRHENWFDDTRHPRGRTYCRWGGFIDGVDEFDPLFFKMTPYEAAHVDPQERLFLQCAYATLEDAGYTREGLRERTQGGRVGVYVGVMYEEYPLFGAQAQSRGTIAALTGSPSSIANRVSYFCNFSGPSMAVDSMCSSSLTTLHLACQSLAAGECEAALAGGVNASIHPNKYILLEQWHFASSKGRCESFGRGGDGYVPGEGVGAALLKPLARAQADGDHIYGVIRASAINHGGKTNGYTVPNPNAQGAVIAQALQRAGLDPSWISYVEAHGTGTSLGDPIEIAGLTQAYDAARLPRGECPIGSVKSNIGHCESAAGIAGLTKVLLQMRHAQIAPSLHSDVLNPNIDFADSPFFVPQSCIAWPRPQRLVDGVLREIPRIAGLSSFGAGGSNAHVVVEQYTDTAAAAPAVAPSPQIIVLSARSGERLRERARQLAEAIEAGRYAEGDLADIAYTLQTGREAMAARLAFVATALADIVARLRGYLDGIPDTVVSGVVAADAATRHASSDVRDADAVIAAWVAGADVSWSGQGRRIALPTYPFERGRYWADFARRDEPAARPASGALAITQIWRGAPLAPTAAPARGVLWLLTTAALAGLHAALAARLPGVTIRAVVHGQDGVDFALAGSADAAFARDDAAAGFLGVVDATALDAAYDGGDAIESGKIRLLQQLVERHARDAGAVLQILPGAAAPTLAGARTTGLYQTLGAEYPRLRSRSVEIDAPESLSDPVRDDALAARIVDELSAPAAETQVRYRGGERQAADFESRPLPEAVVIAPRPDAVVLITGGTGGLGAALADHLVAGGVRNLIVLGRDELPPPEAWSAGAADPARAARLRRLAALVARGARVRYASVRLSDADALRTALAPLQAELGPITSVYHCAGSTSRNPAFIRKTPADIARVAEPKIAGLRALDAALAGHALDSFVLFSSVAGAVPSLGAGQADYALANAYMDRYARVQASRGRREFRAVQWPLWRETGMGEGVAPSAAYQRSGLALIETRVGLDLLARVQQAEAVVVLPVADARFDVAGLLRPAPEAAAPVSKPPAAAPRRGDDRRRVLSAWLRAVFMREFGLPEAELADQRPFGDYGVDSILLTQATQAMSDASGQAIDPAVLFEHDTLGKLAEHFDNDAAFTLDFLGIAPAAATLAAHEIETLVSTEPTRPASALADGDDAIAVVGYACRLPGAPDRDAYWRLLAAGESAIRPLPAGRWGDDDAAHYVGGWIDDVALFDPAFFGLHEADARIMDPQARIVLEETLAALCDAGYGRDEVAGRRVGVYLGGRSQPLPGSLDAVFAAPNPILGLGQNYLATNVSRFFNFSGPSLVVDTACSSGIAGMSFAADALRAGRIDMAIAGAVSLLHGPVAHDLFAARNILSPDGRFRLFERDAGGEVLGEGAALVVLRRFADAVRDGDRIAGVVRAIAVNNDGRTLGPGSPSLAAQRDVLRDALTQAGREAADVGYIEVNGGGSPVLDSIEIKTLSAVYRLDDTSLAPCHVGSIKPNVGHLLLTSGIAAFVRCLLSLEHRQIPPFLSALEPFGYYDFAASRIVFNRQTIDWNVSDGRRRLAALSSFADGGTNCHVLVEEYAADATYRQTRHALPLPPLNRRDLSAPKPGAAPRSAAPPLPEENRVVTFWGQYVDTSL